MLWKLDPFLIWAFRIVPAETVAFLLGCGLLACLALGIGYISSMVVKAVNRKWYRNQYAEMIRMHNLSVDALRHGSKDAYLAANREAMDAFGKYFFSQVGIFTISLWPVTLILAWMDLRFRNVPLEIYGVNVPYFVTFVVIYIFVRMLVGPQFEKLGPCRRLALWAEHRDGIIPQHFEDIGKE